MTTPSTPDQPSAQPAHDDQNADRDDATTDAGTDPAGAAEDATTDAGPVTDVGQVNDEDPAGEDPAEDPA